MKICSACKNSECLPRRTLCSKCSYQVTKRRAQEKLVVLRQQFGGKCSHCEFNEVPSALEFHHLDKLTKSFGISSHAQKLTLEKLQQEASKCILLCSNCHQLEERRERRDHNFSLGILVCNQREAHKEFLYDNGQCRLCFSQYSAQRRDILSNHVKNIHGGCCRRCKNSNLDCLEFHHLDPSIKEFTVLEKLSLKQLPEIIRESLKCILLCRNCHRGVEAGVYSLNEIRQHPVEYEYEEDFQITTLSINGGQVRQPDNYCSCGNKISHKSRQCVQCEKQSREKISWPPTQELLMMLQSSNYRALGRELGVSDNAIRKRIRNHPA